MKKSQFISISLVTVCLFWQCNNENVAPVQAKINFDNLAVGQKSLYVAWESNNIWDQNVTFKQTTDTLSLTVISEELDGFKVEEKQFNQPNYPPYYYYFKTRGDSLYIQPLPTITLYPTYNILFLGGSLQYILKDNNLPKLLTNQWGTPTEGKPTELIGKINNIKIMDKEYDTAFVYFNSRDRVFDGPTITRIYTKKDGFISFQPFGGKTKFARIYNLIP
jgi:hypothetical protein